jgi:alpha-tubulin suppressor-like RCC1 family protein
MSATQASRSQSPPPPTTGRSSAMSVVRYDFVDDGPPPDMKRRELVFDSLTKIVKSQPAKGRHTASIGNSRGTHMFTWGAGYHGQLGRKFVRGHKKYAAIPRLVELNVGVRQITCGALHTAIVTESGQVYTWGDGRQGQLGHSADSFCIQASPGLVEALSHCFVSQIACGRTHTLALTDKGKIYSWGQSKFGQAGHGDRQPVKVPRLVESNERFVSIECGEYHSFACTASGKVYSWGCNEHGEIGHGPHQPDILRPTQITQGLEDVKIKSVACGSIHSALLSEDQQVFICGFGEYFLPNSDQHFYYTPTQVPTKEPIVQLACGQSHIIALAETGNVFCWGAGEYGQLGHGVKGNLAVPRLVLLGKNIAQVSAGRYHSIAITKFGVVYSWGCGENGQLGQGNDENVYLPHMVDSVLGTVFGQIACGEHHTAALTSAPWTKVSKDVLEWQKAAQEEYSRAAKHAKSTNRALASKDHFRIQEEMKVWKADYDEKMNQMDLEEKESQERDVQSVAAPSKLLTEVMEDYMKQTEAQMQRLTARADQNSTPATEADDTKGTSASGPQFLDVDPALYTGTMSLPVTPLAGSSHGDSNMSSRARCATPPARTTHLNAQALIDAIARQSDPSMDSHRTADATSAVSEMGDLVASIGAASAQGPNAGRASMARKTHTASPPGSPTTASSGRAGRRIAAVKRSPQNKSTALVVRQRDDVESTDLVETDIVSDPHAMMLKEQTHFFQMMKQLVVKKGNMHSKQQEQQFRQVVFELRKHFDSLSETVERKSESLDNMRREHELMVRSIESMHTTKKQRQEKLHQLEMQLDTVTIKIAETEENRKNYELNIAHLKEEEMERFNEVEALRKQCGDINSFYRKMNELKIQANEERDLAEQELTEFRKTIDSYQRFVRRQLGTFEKVLEQSHSQMSRRQKRRARHNAKELANIGIKIQALKEASEQQDEEAAKLRERLTELEEQLHLYEDKFQQVTAASGLSDPDAIINKFFFKGEMHQQLEKEIDEKEQRIQMLRLEHSDLLTNLEDSKTQFRDRKWRDVDKTEDECRQIAVRRDSVKQALAKTSERTVLVQEGLMNLVKLIEGSAFRGKDRLPQSMSVDSVINETEDEALWSPNTCKQLFARLGAMISHVRAATPSAPRGHRGDSKRNDSKRNDRVAASMQADKVEKQSTEQSSLSTASTPATAPAPSSPPVHAGYAPEPTTPSVLAS